MLVPVTGNGELRSRRWFGANDLAGFIHRSSLHAEGISRAAIAGRPVIGICNSWSEVVNCNMHFRGARRGREARRARRPAACRSSSPRSLWARTCMKPTAHALPQPDGDGRRGVHSRLADRCGRAAGRLRQDDAGAADGRRQRRHPGDHGHRRPDARAAGSTGGARCRDRLWRYADEFRAGRMSEEAFAELEAASGASAGHCNEMGTASTMASVVEALGMALPGTSRSRPSTPPRCRAAEASGRTGRRACARGLCARPDDHRAGLRQRDRDTAWRSAARRTPSFTCSPSPAGSKCRLPLDRFGELSARTPVLANLAGAASISIEELFAPAAFPRF